MLTAMPTAAERQALAFLAGVALLGGGVRIWQQRHDPGLLAPSGALVTDANPNAETVAGQLSAIDAARTSKRTRKNPPKTKTSSRASRPSTRASGAPAAGKRRTGVSGTDNTPPIIDVDVATAEELETLPRIGAAMAKRIVANRDSFGAFGSLAALGTVRGIGDVMLKTLDPVVSFSGRPRALLRVEKRKTVRSAKRIIEHEEFW